MRGAHKAGRGQAMARIRKSVERKNEQDRHVWRVGKYIRLSREDGNEVSESVVNQDKILTDELPTFFAAGAYELIDTYVDDGASGTTDAERAAFRRMTHDVETGRIDCIIVKNLSRAFRNSANQGKFLEEFIPLYRTRFISLYQPRLDTLLDPEIVHSLEVSITGFMNEQYAYKTSCDVRRSLKSKRERGEFVGAVPVYGYAKDPEDKNRLVVDEDAAAVVREIYAWFVAEGMSKAEIARRLNERGVPNPTAYKRDRGFRYNVRGRRINDGLWSPTTISAILKNPLYIGTLQQGKQRMVSYKVHKAVRVPESEWAVVENAAPPIVEKPLFDTAQALHRGTVRPDAKRVGPTLFAGLLRCADCGRSMGRQNARGRVSYVCRTHSQKLKTACAKRTIRQDRLEEAVLETLRALIGTAALSETVAAIDRAPSPRTDAARSNARLERERRELEKTSARLDGLYFEWKGGGITREQYRQLREQLESDVSRHEKTAGLLARECAAGTSDADGEDPYLAAFLKHRNIRGLTRGLLVELVDGIYIRADGSAVVSFRFEDPYRRTARRT